MTSSKYLVCQQSDTTLGHSVYVRWAPIVKAYICSYFYGGIADWKKGFSASSRASNSQIRYKMILIELCLKGYKYALNRLSRIWLRIRVDIFIKKTIVLENIVQSMAFLFLRYLLRFSFFFFLKHELSRVWTIKSMQLRVS